MKSSSGLGALNAIELWVGNEKPYRVVVGTHLVSRLGEYVSELGSFSRVALITDETVNRLWGDAAISSLEAAGVEVRRIVMPPGETQKSWEGLARVCEELASFCVGRDDLIVALGGGVVGDLAGLAAALHMRGIAYVQVPTTLLAQVDSSVGGKTAIDTHAGKNMVGAFWPPKIVIADINCLATLPDRDFHSGFAEVIKYALLGSPEFFLWLEANRSRVLAREPSTIQFIIDACVRMKAKIVEEDERERGRRALLNLGHTFGHAIEAESNFEILHGEAVALGCALAFRYSSVMGLLPSADARRVELLIRRSSLPAHLPDLPLDLDADCLVRRMSIDKKATSNGLTLVLADGIGAARVVQKIDPLTVRGFLIREGAKG